MSRRLKITLPDGLAAQLDELAAHTGEPVARLAGQMVREGIAEASPNGNVRQPRAELAPVLHDALNEDEPDQRGEIRARPRPPRRGARRRSVRAALRRGRLLRRRG